MTENNWSISTYDQREKTDYHIDVRGTHPRVEEFGRALHDVLGEFSCDLDMATDWLLKSLVKRNEND